MSKVYIPLLSYFVQIGETIHLRHKKSARAQILSTVAVEMHFTKNSAVQKQQNRDYYFQFSVDKGLSLERLHLLWISYI